MLNNRHTNKHFENAYNKYGKDAFEFSIIEIINIEKHKKNIFKKKKFIILLFIILIKKAILLKNGIQLEKHLVFYKVNESSISSVARGIMKTSVNSTFKFETDSSDFSKTIFAKEVDMFDLDGSFVKRFNSFKDAADYIGTPKSAISAVTNGKSKTAKGYRFKYSDDSVTSIESFSKKEIEKYIQIRENPIKGVSEKRKVAVYDLKGNFLNKYDSISDCAKSLGILSANISGVVRGVQKTAKNYIFKYI